MVNVIPLNDDKEHLHNGQCWCGPKVEWQDPETGEIYANGPSVVHNSEDCREVVENLLQEGVGEDKQWATIID